MLANRARALAPFTDGTSGSRETWDRRLTAGSIPNRRGGDEAGHSPARDAARSLLVSCHDGASGVTAPTHPAITSALSLRTRPTCSAPSCRYMSDADSVAVRFSLPGNASPADSLTPAVSVAGDSALVLSPDSFRRAYTLRPVAYGAGGRSLGEALDFTTERSHRTFRATPQAEPILRPDTWCLPRARSDS
jgi:hypothetical protein